MAVYSVSLSLLSFFFLRFFRSDGIDSIDVNNCNLGIWLRCTTADGQLGSHFGRRLFTSCSLPNNVYFNSQADFKSSKNILGFFGFFSDFFDFFRIFFRSFRIYLSEQPFDYSRRIFTKRAQTRQCVPNADFMPNHLTKNQNGHSKVGEMPTF